MENFTTDLCLNFVALFLTYFFGFFFPIAHAVDYYGKLAHPSYIYVIYVPLKFDLVDSGEYSYYHVTYRK